MLQKAYGDDCPSTSTVYEWYERFRDGRESLEDDPRIERPRTTTNDKNVQSIRDFLVKDRRLTCRMITEE
ncbi:Protein GVQW3 [Anthophora quadrimaculata]